MLRLQSSALALLGFRVLGFRVLDAVVVNWVAVKEIKLSYQNQNGYI